MADLTPQQLDITVYQGKFFAGFRFRMLDDNGDVVALTDILGQIRDKPADRGGLVLGTFDIVDESPPEDGWHRAELSAATTLALPIDVKPKGRPVYDIRFTYDTDKPQPLARGYVIVVPEVSRV